MRIACPSCGAEYDVADSMLAARRMVRCARCGHDWAPPPAPAGLGQAGGQHGPAPAAPPPVREAAAAAPPAPVPVPAASAAPPIDLPVATITAPQAPELPKPAPETRPPAKARAGRTAAGRGMLRTPSPLAGAAWGASVALLAGLAWAGYAWRDQVVHAWPPSARLYVALGLLAPP